MKAKLLFVLLAVLTGWVYAQTWTRHLAWEDLVPAWEDHPVAEAYNVIPAIGGGYLMQGVLTIHEYDDYYINVFWKVSNGGEVLWRQDFYAPEDRISCLVSNGVDRYYALSPHYHRNILYEYDAQMNPVRSITIDSLFTNGEQIELFTMIGVDGGMVFGGRNIAKPFIVKLDYDLNLLWSQTFSNIANDGIRNLKQRSDGGIIASGTIQLIRLNSDGDSLWTNCGTPTVTSLAWPVCNPDGTYSLLGSYDGVTSVVRFNDYGEFMEAHQLLLPGSTCSGGSLISTSDGQLAYQRMLIHYDSTPFFSLGLLHKLSQYGEALWSNIFLPVDSSVWEYHSGGMGTNPLFVDEDGYYVLCSDEMVLIRADSNGNAVDNNDPSQTISDSSTLHVYPNPSYGQLNIQGKSLPVGKCLRFSLYNLKGQKLYNTEFINSGKDVYFNLTLLGRDMNCHGILLYNVYNGNKMIACGKFTIANERRNK